LKIMNVSRRDFLYYAACLPAGSFVSASLKRAGPILSEIGKSRRSPAGATVLLNFSCTLPESREGYRASLEAAEAPLELVSCPAQYSITGGPPHPLPFSIEGARGEPDRPESRLAGMTWDGTVAEHETARLASLIVPAAALTEPDQLRWLRARIDDGATALVESGGAFLSPEEFRVQRYRMRSQLGLTMLDPVGLWDGDSRLNGPPYIDFSWPVPARIRDFSRVIPLAAPNAQPVAIQENRVVGLKFRLGGGTLVFLGSPLGPHLFAGDREAQRWFESFLAATRLSGGINQPLRDSLYSGR
jgi:hypothetical protein